MLEINSSVSTATGSEDRLNPRGKRQRPSDKTGKRNQLYASQHSVNLRQDKTIGLRVKGW